MKYFASTMFIFLSMTVKGQGYVALNAVARRDTIPNRQAIIYGNFIQRLGFSSGGFPQDIRLINLDTDEVLTFRVKPTFKSAKENTFVYFIKPGNYAILNYWWTQSKWYGGKIFTEPIYKGIDATDELEQKISSGQIDPKTFQRYRFTITENALNYLGTWNFDTGIVSFTEDKARLDDMIKSKFQRLDFLSAKFVIPT